MPARICIRTKLYCAAFGLFRPFLDVGGAGFRRGVSEGCSVGRLFQCCPSKNIHRRRLSRRRNRVMLATTIWSDDQIVSVTFGTCRAVFENQVLARSAHFAAGQKKSRHTDFSALPWPAARLLRDVVTMFTVTYNGEGGFSRRMEINLFCHI